MEVFLHDFDSIIPISRFSKLAKRFISRMELFQQVEFWASAGLISLIVINKIGFV
jgi:hypothetical protein